MTVLEEQVCNTFAVRKANEYCFDISLDILNFSIENCDALFQGHAGRPKFHIW